MSARRRVIGVELSRCAAALLAGVLAGVGCSPGHILARQMIRPPNALPTWLAPEPRVEVELPALREHLARATVEVGPPPAQLDLRWLEPGDYQTRPQTRSRAGRKRKVFELRVQARLPPKPLPGVPPARGTVFLLHGYGLNLAGMVPWALVLAEAGYRPVLVDLRGHGASTGKRFTLGLVEAEDLRQTLDALTARGLVEGPVAALGESFGAALALRWAARDARVHAVVALAPYAELAPAVQGLAAEYIPWFPRAWVRSALRRLPGLLGVSPEALDTTPWVSGLETPVLYVAAGQDRIAPPQAVARLARLQPGPARYLPIWQAGHEDLPYHFEALRRPVLDWLETHLQPEASDATQTKRYSGPEPIPVNPPAR